MRLATGVASALIPGHRQLVLPVVAFAQEATITGTVSDATGGVLPGVTVTATNRRPATRSSA